MVDITCCVHWLSLFVVSSVTQVEVERMLMLFSQVVSMWRSIVLTAGKMDFDSASAMLINLDGLTASFHRKALTVADLAHPHRCNARAALPQNVLNGIIGGSAALGVAAVVLAVLPRLVKSKAKVV